MITTIPTPRPAATEKIKALILMGLIFCLGCITTCKFNQPEFEPFAVPFQDTTFLHQWRKEKTEKKELISFYQTKVNALEKSKDSLTNEVKQKKRTMNFYRSKSQALKNQLDFVLNDSADVNKDNIRVLTDSLFANQEKSNTSCDETIQLLENSIQIRDDQFLMQKQIESTLRDLNQWEELQNKNLSIELNQALKANRKAKRQSKILSASLLILSGVSATLFISKNRK